MSIGKMLHMHVNVQGSTFQAFCGGVVAFVFFAVQCSTVPYATLKGNLLKAVAEAQLFITLFISVVLRTDSADNQDTITADNYGTILTVVFFVAPLTFVATSIYGRCCTKAQGNGVAYLQDPKIGDDKTTAETKRKQQELKREPKPEQEQEQEPEPELEPRAEASEFCWLHRPPRPAFLFALCVSHSNSHHLRSSVRSRYSSAQRQRGSESINRNSTDLWVDSIGTRSGSSDQERNGLSV